MIGPIVASMLAAGCGRPAPAPVAADAAAVADAHPIPTFTAERRAAAESALGMDCAICHSLDLVQSQRLTRGQWEKEVKKMAGWGAPVEEDGPLLVELLAADFSPDTLEPPPQTIPFDSAAAEVIPDEKPAPGDAQKGEAIYRAACQSCHGERGEGTRGPSLAGKPVVFRARDFAAAVEHGRGRMPAFAGALSPEAIADLRAWLAARPLPGL
jgi:mono/diheme cytochrome c family protein